MKHINSSFHSASSGSGASGGPARKAFGPEGRYDDVGDYDPVLRSQRRLEED